MKSGFIFSFVMSYPDHLYIEGAHNRQEKSDTELVIEEISPEPRNITVDKRIFVAFHSTL